jgi:DNA-binding NtrC family response regulator
MDFGFDNFIGVSEAATGVRHRAVRAAENDGPLFVVGETGSGRETLAKIIHHHSRRRIEPIRIRDAAAEGNWNLENDAAGTMIIRNAEALFERNRAGYEELLNKPCPYRLISLGTPKILEAIGSVRTVATIVIPPLRSRPEDIPALAEYFLRRIGEKTGRPGLMITPEGMRRLVRSDWPGNVGELENTLTTAAGFIVGDMIETDHLVFVTSDDETAASEPEGCSPQSLEELERTQIMRSLEGNGWNFSQTAQQLGIGRTTLWRKIKKYNLRQAATA